MVPEIDDERQLDRRQVRDDDDVVGKKDGVGGLRHEDLLNLDEVRNDAV